MCWIKTSHPIKIVLERRIIMRNSFGPAHFLGIEICLTKRERLHYQLKNPVTSLKLSAIISIDHHFSYLSPPLPPQPPLLPPSRSLYFTTFITLQSPSSSSFSPAIFVYTSHCPFIIRHAHVTIFTTIIVITIISEASE